MKIKLCVMQSLIQTVSWESVSFRLKGLTYSIAAETAGER
jgi:hypothetical protein